MSTPRALRACRRRLKESPEKRTQRLETKRTRQRDRRRTESLERRSQRLEQRRIHMGTFTRNIVFSEIL